ncbi:MAG: hypothetical protein HRT73_16315, partial [Flavobacteriales bacterium]|nr:hypothetical protein [Flavobacteriales bacterium]
IREKINQIKESGKKTVLIIDDLDRMDPDHTFRILNVISTHYDTVRENQDFEPNKFGFDKIILVGDYDNIQKIFEHRYGEKVNFSGYMTKFFSVEPFHYNNAEMMTSLIFKIINKEINNGLIRNSISLVFKSLIYGGQISLRDILKFQNFDYTTIINGYRNQVQGNNLSNGLFTPIIIYLYKIGSKDVIISKLSKCKDTEIEMHRMKYNYCWHLISELVNHNENVNGLYKYKYKDHDLTFTLQRTFDFDFNEPQNINIKNSIGEDVNIGDFQFDQHDFIGLLIENIEKINYQPF